MFPFQGGHIEEEDDVVISDQELLTNLQREMKAFVDSAKSTEPTTTKAKSGKDIKKKLFTIVETAGGVLSPGPNKTLQADLYRSLRLPVLLVGDARVGGISATLCAYESLRVRGYTVHAIVMIDRADTVQSGSKSFIEEHLESIYESIPGDNTSGPHSQAWALGTVPKVFNLSPLPTDGKTLLHAWFKSNEPIFNQLFAYTRQSIALEWRSYNIMREKGLQQVWWPSTDHAIIRPESDVVFLESAHGDQVRTFSMRREDDGSERPTAEGSAGGSGGSVGEIMHAAVQPLTEPTGKLRPLLTTMFDASASWWTQGIGHGHGSMALAIGEASGRYGHLCFPLTLHPPVVALSRFMVERGPGKGWAQRVFYADSGASSIDIALKMAFRLHEVRKGKTEGRGKEGYTVLTQAGAYHGHTLGAINTQHIEQHSILSQHPWNNCHTKPMNVPFVYYRNGKLSINTKTLLDDTVREAFLQDPPFTSTSALLNLNTRLHTGLALAYRNYIEKYFDELLQKHEIGAFLLEPLMLGTSMLRFVDPLFQKIAVEEAKKRSIPVIFDEVATGFYRLGVLSSTDIFHESPDIACYGKVLSGGYLSLSTAITSEEVYKAFYPGSPISSESLEAGDPTAIIHGHAYAANPIACSAALEAIRLLENCDSIDSETGRLKPSFPEDAVRDLSKLPGVLTVYAMGTVLSIQMQPRNTITTPPSAPSVLDGSNNQEDLTEKEPSLASIVISMLRAERIQAYPLNDNIYVMCTPFTSTFDKQRIVRVLRRCLTKAFYLRPSSTVPEVSGLDSRNYNYGPKDIAK
eukprot:scaffold1420_cov182-Ochromonas_danica.AAC.12